MYTIYERWVPDYILTYALKLNYRRLTSSLCWIAAFTIRTNCSPSWGGKPRQEKNSRCSEIRKGWRKRWWSDRELVITSTKCTADLQPCGLWYRLEADLSESGKTGREFLLRSTTPYHYQAPLALSSLTLSRPMILSGNNGQVSTPISNLTLKDTNAETA